MQLQLVRRESVPQSQIVDAQFAQVLAHPACPESFSELSHVVQQLFSAHGHQSERKFRLRQGQVLRALAAQCRRA